MFRMPGVYNEKKYVVPKAPPPSGGGVGLLVDDAF